MSKPLQRFKTGDTAILARLPDNPLTPLTVHDLGSAVLIHSTEEGLYHAQIIPYGPTFLMSDDMLDPDPSKTVH